MDNITVNIVESQDNITVSITENRDDIVIKFGSEVSNNNAVMGLGDMTEAEYVNEGGEGVVLMAAKVNGYTVNANVPFGALFSDTIYDDEALTTRVFNVEQGLINKQDKLPNVFEDDQYLTRKLDGSFNWVNLPDYSGFGDMNKSSYATLSDTIVDNAYNAQKVNNLTVETAVPPNAVFTDTIFNATTIWTALNSKIETITQGDNVIIDASDPLNLVISATSGAFDDSALWQAIAGKEDSFSKNTAFNKNFGTTANTVLEGNAWSSILLNNAKRTYPSEDEIKLSNIEANAKDDQTAAEVLMTGYAIAGATGAITTSDNVSSAIGKLEKGLQTATAGGGDVNVQSDWSVSDAGSDAFIKNKPTTDIANGVTAYSWGNHASAGYLTASSLNGYATEGWVTTNFAASGHTHTFPDYNAWVLKVDSGAGINMISGKVLDISGGTNISLSYASDKLTITGTNTWRGIDDVPVNGQTGESITSNWAYDHNAGTGVGKHIPSGGVSGQYLSYNGTWGTPPNTNTTNWNVQVDGGTTSNISASEEVNFITGNGIVPVHTVQTNPKIQFNLGTLTANWDAGGYDIRARTLTSDVAAGTKPLNITSTTLVTNLNADRLDNAHGSQFLRSDTADIMTSGSLTFNDNIELRFGTGGAESEISSNNTDTIWKLKLNDLVWLNTSGTEILRVKQNGQIVSSLANGTAPFVVASSTLVTNLNADKLDGVQGSQFLRSDATDYKTGGDLIFNDNIHLEFGSSGAESEIWSNGTNTYWKLKRNSLFFQDTAGSVLFEMPQTGGMFEGSDRRLKENIEYLDDTYVTYTRKGDDSKRKRYGVIAQDIEMINPELVTTNQGGLKAVNYTDLLVKENVDLKQRVSALEARLLNLEKALIN